MNLTFPHRETWLHRVNPTMKLVLFVAQFIVVILMHNPNTLGYFTLSLLLMLALWTGHPWKRLLIYSSPFVLVFVSSSTGMMFFGSGTTTWYKLGIIHITEESFYRGVHLGFRALAMAASGLLFSLTTRPVALFYSLMQQCRLSPKYAYSFLAGLRMIPIVVDEFVTRRHALKARGGRQARGIYKTLKFYAIPLLAQSIRRAQRISVAMQAKRFMSAEKRTNYYEIGFSRNDLYFLILLAGFCALAVWAGKTIPFVPVSDVR